MKKVFKKFPEQVQRLLLVVSVLAGSTLLFRFVLIPRPYRDTQLQRKTAVERVKAKGIYYAGSGVCATCHEDELNVKKIGYHKNLSCETCHGAAASHADNPAEIKPFIPEKREFCAHCHTYNASRPTGFPQINPVIHNPLKPCMNCHNPHDPTPLEAPQTCSACHADISRTKEVSPHVLLGCAVCHNAPEEHKITPRIIKPSIPSKREFCGQCHSKASSVKGTPKVDLLTHGEKYLCWQCHYPHMPEVHR